MHFFYLWWYHALLGSKNSFMKALFHVSELCDMSQVPYCVWDHLKVSIKWCQSGPEWKWVHCNIHIISLCNGLIEDHKPLWHITVHLSSLISLIPTDGKLILLYDRLNPINSVCPTFTSPLSHSPGPKTLCAKDEKEEFWDSSLDQRLEELAHG